METLSIRTGFEPIVLFRKLSKLERSGRYAEALGLISDGWDDLSRVPETEHFDVEDAAEMRLRYGSLIGFYGHNEMIAGAQEHSRNILTSVREVFQELRNVEKIAECENLIALTYWRTGEYRETDLWLDIALDHNLPRTSLIRLQSFKVRSLNFLSLKKHEQNIAYCRSVEEDFRKFGDALLNASLCSNIGISLKDTGRSSEALTYFTLAKTYHEKSRHRIYLATVENNLALLHMNEGNFRLAHSSVDAAIGIYKKLKDKTREGSSLETKAQICLAENRPDAALNYTDRSIAVLRKSENQAYLAESLMTRSKTLLVLDNFQEAVISMMEAVDITRRQTGEKAARALIDEFQTALDPGKKPIKVNFVADPNELELVIPASLSKYSEYSGVWINNSHLDDLGIPRGSLAVTVNEKVNRGDLVAAVERETGAVVCGYYDSDFGMVCLESGSGQPYLFDENAVTIKGKIVGVCRDGQNADGKMIVEPIGQTA